MSPFSPGVRYEILKRDRWTCQSEACIASYIGLEAFDWRSGFMLNGAHNPEDHQKAVDFNMDHGRCLCVACHIVEEIERGNISGASMLWQFQTIRNKEWMQNNNWQNPKPGFDWYIDWVRSDEETRKDLAIAFADICKININSDPVYKMF
jgi:hypothetical protein